MSCPKCTCGHCKKEQKQETRFFISHASGKPMIVSIQRPIGSPEATYKKTAKEALDDALFNARCNLKAAELQLITETEYVKDLEALAKEYV